MNSRKIIKENLKNVEDILLWGLVQYIVTIRENNLKYMIIRKTFFYKKTINKVTKRRKLKYSLIEKMKIILKLDREKPE